MNGSNRQNGLQFKKYNHLTAQIIRGSVRKKIYDIKKRGLSAADEILDDIEKYFEKRIGIQSNEAKNHRTILQNAKKTDDLHSNGNHAIYNEIAETLAEGLELIDKLKSSSLSASDTVSFENMLMRIIKANRDAWRAFILSIAGDHDAESVACFGTNLVYGGFLTRSDGNSPQCVFFDLPSNVSSSTREKLKERLRKENSAGRRAFMIRGTRLLDSELLKIYRQFTDSAFILVDTSADPSQPSLPTLGIYNVMYICDGKTDVDIKSVPLGRIIALKTPELPFVGGVSDWAESNRKQSTAQIHSSIGSRSAGQGSDVKLTYGSASADKTGISRLFLLLSSPKLPIELGFDEIFRIICELEAFISENNNRAPIIYNVNNW